MALVKKYNQENYLNFVEELGIYDYLNSSIVEKIQALGWESTVASTQKDLDAVSLDFYNSEQLWWVLAIYNKIIDPTEYELEVSVLYIPARLDVELLLSDWLKDN